MLHRNLVSLVGGLCLAALEAQASDPKPDLALQLVRAMKVDEQAAMKIHNLANSLWRYSDLPQKERDCALKLGPADFTDWLAHIARRELSTEEMRAAIEYFQSEIGKKHIEVMRAEQGLSSATFFKQEPDDQARMLVFLESPAGYRLVTRGLLTTSMEASGFIDRKGRSSMQHCED